jgi:hypothetical protein
MRAVDIFSLAIAALITLLTLIVEPWSKPWWIGVIAASAITLSALGHIVYKALEAHSFRRGTMLAILGTVLIAVGTITGLVGAFMEDWHEAAPTNTPKPPTSLSISRTYKKLS